MAPRTPAKATASTDKQDTKPLNRTVKAMPPRPKDYTSHGITDNDIFLLPGSDFQLLGLLTLLASVVRIFRIYQPSSVVFDEVQYV